MKTLSQLIVDYGEKYDGPDAVQKILNRLTKNPNIWAAALGDEVLVRRMLDQLIRDLRHSERTSVHAIFRGDTAEDKALRLSGQRRLTKRMEETLLDWPTFSRKPLRDCTFADLTESVSSRREQANSQHTAAAFEETVAKELPNKRVTVGDALTPSDIAAAYAQVYSATEAA